jgi:hypothetical protein
MTSAETFLYDPLVDWMNARKGGQMLQQDAGAEHENPSVSYSGAVAKLTRARRSKLVSAHNLSVVALFFFAHLTRARRSKLVGAHNLFVVV